MTREDFMNVTLDEDEIARNALSLLVSATAPGEVADSYIYIIGRLLNAIEQVQTNPDWDFGENARRESARLVHEVHHLVALSARRIPAPPLAPRGPLQ